MRLRPHQIAASKKASEIIKKKKLCYVFGPPRVGKSLIALETMKEFKSVLVLTKKNAIDGWKKYTSIFNNFDVVNYEKVSKVDSARYDAVVVDEAHNFGTRPKASLRCKLVREFCKNKIILFLSGTPYIETPLSIFHQFYLSSYSPFRGFKNFYDFFKTFGIPNLTYVAGRNFESYTKSTPELLNVIKDYTIKVSYEDAGFNYQNYDKCIYVESPEWLKQYKSIKSSGFLGSIPLDSAPKVYQALHQFEGGTYKDGKIFKLKPKVDWLVRFCEAHKDKKIAVMSYFKAEQNYLNSLKLKNAEVFSSSKYCEGVDLSHFDLYILYSFGYSGAKFVQLRDRIVNITKDEKTFVLIPLIKGGLCENIYRCVSNKRDFNSAVYKSII